MLSEVITCNPEKCVGCNRCIRVCPIEEANIALETDGKMSVRIDSEKCIACGACVPVCCHGARVFKDDTERFFNDLKSGVRISVFTAPAVKTNFSDWGRMLSWLRSLGVDKVYDVSLGADICTWAHIRYLQRNPGKHLITQPCPAIVNYILKHRTGIAGHLSPVHSPMLCTAVYMRKYENVKTKIAALSPCIAKTHEFEATGLVDYNVTFSGLQKYIEREAPRFPDKPGGFDHYESGLGFLYPMPGGLKENVEHYLGKALRVDKSEGQQMVYKALDEYAEQPEGRLPVLFDVLNCAEGCNCGTGCVHGERTMFDINTTLDTARQAAIAGDGAERLDKLYERFDATLHLQDFIRHYKAAPVKRIHIKPDDVERAFSQLNKHDEASRNFNCGACGSESCLEMAQKIAKGINTPLNCMEKAHMDISEANTRFLDIQATNIKNLEAIRADIMRVKEITEKIVASMAHVTDSIQDFNKMTNDIQKIAMQINIISLNASIEAARAGQYGRSFGVVAGEIRTLANGSKSSVQDSEKASEKATGAIRLINEMILQISESINYSYGEIAKIMDSTRDVVNAS